MFEPLNVFKSIKENYKVMFEDYKVSIWLFNFILIPFIFAIFFTLTLDLATFTKIINSSIVFFSIIVGFLINVLILLVSIKKVFPIEHKKGNLDEKKREEKIEKLRKHLAYNILTGIFFGIVLLLFIIFLPSYKWEIIIKGFSFALSQFIILFLFGYFIVSLLNILSKFGVYIMTRFKI